MFLFSSDWNYSINAKTFDELDIELFRNYKFGTLFNYVFLTWGLTILKFALLIADIYTCIKLLAFNSWSNNIVQPYLPFHISKWLFSGCILACILLTIWDAIMGIKIYRSRNISLVYINNFAKTMYSLSNYSIFCVLDRITPKGSYQKIAFFTFFELKDCFKLLFTDTPRQVINGLTLWSVLVTVNSDLGNLETFNGLITKIKIIAKTNHQEAVLLSFMLFSFIIWLIFITKLAFAMVFSIFVYYKLINQHKYNGLREFVCITIRHRVDSIVDKQRRMKNQNCGPYGRGLGNTSTTSLFRMDDLESSGANGGFNKENSPPLKISKDTSFTVYSRELENDTSRISSMSSNTETANLDEKLEDPTDSDTKELLRMVSAIQNNFQKLEGHNSSILKYPGVISTGIFATQSTDTLPSYHLKGYQTQENLNRPKPPIINTMPNITPARNNNKHIDTPLRAYMREIPIKATNQLSHQLESNDVLDRREKIANEDYSHFIKGRY